MYLICCLLNFRGNVINMQFLPTKLPPVHVPQLFYKSTHIAIDENHRGNCSGLMVPTSKFWGIGSPPNYVRLNYKAALTTIETKVTSFRGLYNLLYFRVRKLHWHV